MNVGRAAFLTETRVKANCKVGCPVPEIACDEQGLSPSHAMWMLAEVINQERVWKNDKLNRWLGYAQAILIIHGFLTLDEAKRCNREA